MLRVICTALVVALAFAVPARAEWRAHIIPAPGRVTAIDVSRGNVRIAVGTVWYRLSADAATLVPAAAPDRPAVPQGALPDARVAVGRDIARAWFADPTDRYHHGVLGDAIEAGALVIERRDGRRHVLRLDHDAVFEDIMPRIAIMGGSEMIVAVKSYLARGATLAIVDPVTATIVAETPPIGHANAWLNPAGITDFDGDGTTDIALVRQPHVLGRLEMWTWSKKQLRKVAEVADVSNHAIGSRVLDMSAVDDFDGDGHPDLAVPSLDRRTLRLIAFAPRPRDIARVSLSSRVVTSVAVVAVNGRRAVLVGLENGQLVLLRE